MNKSLIDPSVFQMVLDSAPNAAAKGQAQYFTPIEWARVLSLALPKQRPAIVDLTCGNGALLDAAHTRGTKHLLGSDIDPCSSVPSSVSSSVSRITSDLTRLYPLLKAAKFHADLFVLNPPWDLYWSRDLLALLAESNLPAVALAFTEHDGRTARATIDSTIGTLCIALDLSSYYGEGFLIANESTLQRLIFAPNAPHSALAAHIWAHLVIGGNICLPPDLNPNRNRNPDSSFKTGVVYFAAGHTCGNPHTYQCADLKAAKDTCEILRANRLLWRKGPEARDYICTDTTADAWAAVAEELDRTTTKTKPCFNLWLDSDGKIQTALSLFDTASDRFTQDQASKLHALHGQRPLQLVLQRHSRRALEEAAGLQPNNPSIQQSNNPSPWRVDPSLTAAVAQAIADYNAVRAPLYPLSKIQRLGYLDEQDDIRCIKDLGRSSLSPSDGGVRGNLPIHQSTNPVFRAGGSYPLRSTTVRVQRSGTKMNLEGNLDEVEWDGQELAFFITDAAGAEHTFMEARLRDKSVKVTIAKPGVTIGQSGSDLKKLSPEESIPCPIDFTLQELVEHFEIPAVPDVAALQPEAYNRNLQLLAEIESLCT